MSTSLALNNWAQIIIIIGAQVLQDHLGCMIFEKMLVSCHLIPTLFFFFIFLFLIHYFVLMLLDAFHLHIICVRGCNNKKDKLVNYKLLADSIYFSFYINL